MIEQISPSGLAEARETPKVLYAVNFVLSVIGAFLITIATAYENPGWMVSLPLLGLAVGSILFNATGFVRPKRIDLTSEGLRYRPVWGRTMAVRRMDIAAFDTFTIRYGSGFVSLETRADPLTGRRGSRKGLGFFGMALAFEAYLEAWRQS
ncbi:hypothetical protein [Brevundimonas sp. FT23028]|uniref:hypothetical protein n=1 Tax=Brevundimonas sp. FT23028 TaxID=3393748 RepID=UPI003B587BFE